MISQNSRKPFGFGMSLVWPGLWVGSAHSVSSHFLETEDVSILVWATPEVSPPTVPETVRMIKVLVTDDNNSEISPFFPTVTEAFKESSKGGGMVVVCRAGVSRSATLALAALVGDTDLPEMNLKYAYEKIKEARPFIRPNAGFFSQLISYEAEVRGESTVALVPSPYNASEKIPDIYLKEWHQTTGPTFKTFVPL